MLSLVWPGQVAYKGPPDVHAVCLGAPESLTLVLAHGYLFKDLPMLPGFCATGADLNLFVCLILFICLF